jgi:hypothetical protein
LRPQDKSWTGEAATGVFAFAYHAIASIIVLAKLCTAIYQVAEADEEKRHRRDAQNQLRHKRPESLGADPSHGLRHPLRGIEPSEGKGGGGIARHERRGALENENEVEAAVSCRLLNADNLINLRGENPLPVPAAVDAGGIRPRPNHPLQQTAGWYEHNERTKTTWQHRGENDIAMSCQDGQVASSEQILTWLQGKS